MSSTSREATGKVYTQRYWYTSTCICACFSVRFLQSYSLCAHRLVNYMAMAPGGSPARGGDGIVPLHRSALNGTATNVKAATTVSA